MNDNKEFDDYIKGLFDKKPKVPSELRWEEMDFDLPNTNEQNKSNWKKYLALLLFLLIGIAIVYFGIDREKATITQLTEQPLNDVSVSNLIDRTELSKEDKSLLKNTLENKETSNKEQTLTKKITSNVSITKQDNPSSSTLNSKLNKANPVTKMVQEIEAFAPAHNEYSFNFTYSKNDIITKSSNNDVTPIAKQTIDTPIKPTPVITPSSPTIVTSTPKTAQSIIKTLPVISIGDLPTFNKTILKSTPNFTETDYADKNAKFCAEDIFIAYGLNNYKIKIDSTSILGKSINSAIGNSLKAGVRFRLNDNWTTNLQLKYDRYHSTFEHIHPLDTLYNGQRLVRIYRYEQTFHNNYTNTLGIQLGLEGKWQIAKRLQLSAGLGITPTYTLSATGKTTIDRINVERLVFDDEISRFSMNGGLSAGAIIPIHEFINVEATYQHNRFFLNHIFINHSTRTDQQNVFSLGLTYQLMN